MGAAQVFHFDAYGNSLGFSPDQAATTFLYNNEQLDLSTGLYNFRARPYDSLTGRLLGLDPFAGDPISPQSFHKYLFAHGDPVQGADPTGKFLTISLALGSLIRSGLGITSGATLFSMKAFAVANLVDIAFLSWFRTAYVLRDGRDQFPQKAYDKYVHSNINEVRIVGAAKTAGEVFERLARFNQRDFMGSPTVPINEVRGLNDKLTWDMTGWVEEIGQADFDVRVDQFDRQRRFLSVVTSAGHPLSGFRFWEVEAANDQSHDYTIRTGAVEHNTGYQDSLKDHVGGPTFRGWSRGHEDVLSTWETQLSSLKTFAQPDSSDGSLIRGKWDDSFIDGFKTKVNWRYE